MASTYSDRLRIELIGTGDQSGTWGITTNTNLGTIIEEAIAGLASVTMTDADYTLSVVDGGTDEARQMMIWLSGTLSATRNVICPAEEKLYFVKNGTTGGQDIVFKTSAGTGVTVPNGQTAVVICDGTNVVDGITYIPALGSAWIKNTGNGYTTFDGSQNGLALTANAMSTGSKYTPAVKFGSTDASFTTTNPKFGAAIVGVATEAYSADTDGGMAMSFWTSPDDPGTGSGLIERMRLTQYGTLGLGASGQQNMLLRMSTDITGGTIGYGIYMDSEVQPDVTSSGRYFSTVSSTGTNSGTPYTINNLYHFLATQGTFDADSTVTNQYGFFSGGSLLSADRNYSFFSDLGGEASKTNTNLVRATNVVTVTSASHGFTDGDLVAITSATASFNGIFTVTSVTTNSFTYSQTGSDQTATDFGYSTRVNRWSYYTASGSIPSLFGPTIISTSNGLDGLRITQIGTGNALVVEDSTNPDATPFVVDTNGRVISGSTTTYTAASGLIPQIGVAGNTAGTSSMAIGRYSADANGGYYVFTKSRSTTIGTPGTIVSSGDSLGQILWTADDGSATPAQAAYIVGQVDGTPGAGDMPGRLVFATTADGASNPTERLRIDSEGRMDMRSSLSPTGTSTASSISGTTLTVGGTVTGTFNVGDRIFGTTTNPVDPNTFIVAFGTGTGGAGTYTLSNSQTVASTSIYAVGGGVNVFRFTDTDTTQGAAQPMGAIEWYGSDSSTPGAGVKAYITSISESSTPDASLIFGTSDNVASTQAVERMRITSAGRVLIGTTSYIDAWNTAQNLILAGTGNPGISVVQASNSTAPGLLNFAKSRSTTPGDWTTIVQSGDNLGQINFLGADGTTRVNAAAINAEVDGTPGTNDMPGRLIFSTTADGASSATERMRIDNAGRVSIGTTAPTSSQTLIVNRAATGNSTQNVIVTNSVMQSDVTTAARYFQSNLSTAAASFTLASAIHYEAHQLSIGAGSTVTTQTGFLARSSLIGATNNYGFYGDIPAGTGDWNFYAAGTADNYFAGKVGIGAEPNPAYKLDVYDASAAYLRLYGNSDTVFIVSRSSADATAPVQQFYKSRGTSASPTIVANGDITGRVIFYGYDGSTNRPTAEIRSSVDGTPGAADMPGDLNFLTTADGASSSTTRVTISSGGLVTLASGSGLSISSTAVSSPTSANGNVFSGTYNPAANGTNTNVAAVTYNTAQYIRVGNYVTVSGSVAITATAANTNTILRMTVPIASNLSGALMGGAGASASGTYGQGGMAILGDSTNDGAEMRCYPTSTNSQSWQYTFGYRIV